MLRAKKKIFSSPATVWYNFVVTPAATPTPKKVWVGQTYIYIRLFRDSKCLKCLRVFERGERFGCPLAALIWCIRSKLSF